MSSYKLHVASGTSVGCCWGRGSTCCRKGQFSGRPSNRSRPSVALAADRPDGPSTSGRGFTDPPLSGRRASVLEDNVTDIGSSSASDEPTSTPSGGQWRGDKSFYQVKEEYLRPVYLPATFVGSSLTVGVYLANKNFSLMEDPGSFVGTMISTGLMLMAIAWLLFDFFDEPTAENNISNAQTADGRPEQFMWGLFDYGNSTLALVWLGGVALLFGTSFFLSG